MQGFNLIPASSALLCVLYLRFCRRSHRANCLAGADEPVNEVHDLSSGLGCGNSAKCHVLCDEVKVVVELGVAGHVGIGRG